METFYTYTDGYPRQRIVALRPTRDETPAEVWDIRLELCPARGWCRLKYTGNLSLALKTLGTAYWFAVQVPLEAFKDDWWKNGWAPGTASVSCPPAAGNYWRSMQNFPFAVDVPRPDQVNWDRMLSFAPRIATTKFIQPLLDWMQEYMPEPWSLFPTDPLGMCRALCPYPLAGDPHASQARASVGTAPSHDA